ncbi:MAG: DUF3604 domain-containing protein, partial [Myxococcales bacterium]|nr:DUF3604 domain-containing protein [Myxococcales bacterium]
MKRVLSFVVGILLIAAIYLAAIWFGAFGEAQRDGQPSTVARPAAVVAERAAAQRRSSERLGAPTDKQILFGDLHVHTTWSIDAYLRSLPVLQGEGAHPPADACDFARYCSALDFFSLNDHAESLTPAMWQQTRDAIRQCNAVGGEGDDPDLVALLGWEWTQMGTSPDDHYGHKNVVLRGTADDEVPARPIAASGYSFDAMRQKGGNLPALAMTLLDFGNRQIYFDFAEKRKLLREAPLCEPGVDVRELPPDCVETAATPRELFEKLDQWGHDAIVIPHGNAWGNTTPAGVSWDKQLRDGNHDPDRQTLIEVYSGHGNSEEHRPWRAQLSDEDGNAVCPEPSEGYLPACHRAGEIIHERCLAEGLEASECEARAAEARALYLATGPRGEGRLTIPGRTPELWLDAGQCTDCFQPAFDYRAGGSSQYASALTAPGASDRRERRFRFGFIASSDTHYARAGTGYKEVSPLGMTDMSGARATERRIQLEPEPGKPGARAVPIDRSSLIILPGGDVQRTSSFYYTGGLVAAHAAGRGRDALWQAFERREVYGTSGPRILLWFDLLNPPDGDGPVPMGGETEMVAPPRFRVRAIGSFVQQPGCPDESHRGLPAERLAHLCKNECYHPSDARHPIERIEVVRIRPQRHEGERVEWLVDDPWREFRCDGDPAGCEIEFEDRDFTSAGRDAVYYVRALQEETPLINAAGLDCVYDEHGRCA